MAETALADSISTTEQLESSPQGVVKRWVSELDIASHAEEEWRKCAEETIKLHKSEKDSQNSFNILWSNTETLRPALYNSTPKPDVRRRFDEADPVGRYGSLVLKRVLTYSNEEDDLDHAMQDTVLDVLLPGRGVARIKYAPKFRAIPGTEPDPLSDEPQPEEIEYERAPIEHVIWNKFRRGPGETWKEVPWIAFEHRMPKDQLVEMFGEELADKIPLSDSESADRTEDKTIRSLLQTACIWEIWDKVKHRVLFICEKYAVKPLLEEDDPLKLKDFFPIPRPIYSIEDSTSLIPQTLYEKYKSQAEELNKVSRRIDKVVNALKIRGAYASNLSEVASIIEAGDNQMIPIVNASEIAAMGGLEKAIWILPIDKLAGVLNELYQARSATLQTIYEITGLGDIMRGVSNPHETLGAQQLKSQWGTLRLQRMQREVQRFIRDLMRLKAEVIAEHFQQKTLQGMSNVQLPAAQDKQKAQMMMAQAQASGQQVPEETTTAIQHLMQMPTWEDVMALFHSDELRCFRIGIETDSTIEETLTRDAQAMQEAVTAVVNLFTGLAPAIQMGAMSIDVAKTIALSMARTAKMGDAVEDAINQMKQPPPPPPETDNSVEVAKVKAQSDQQISQMREQAAAAQNQQKLGHEQQVAQMEAQATQTQGMQDAALKRMEQEQQAQLQQMQQQAQIHIAQIKAASDERIARMKMAFEAQQAEFERQSKERIAQMTAQANAEEAAHDRDAAMQQAQMNADTTKEVAKQKASAKSE